MDEFSHVEGDRTSMVDVGDKPPVSREATAAGSLALRPQTVAAIRAEETPKADVLATARVAAIQAVKRTWDDVPMCHPVDVEDVGVDFDVTDDGVEARVTVASTGRTGVEMEALNGATRALLTVWDMVKSAEKDDDGQFPETRISDVRVVEKRKGAPAE